ncbi:hypothetical protein D3C87_1463520 [compost metagenome]
MVFLAAVSHGGCVKLPPVDGLWQDSLERADLVRNDLSALADGRLISLDRSNGIEHDATELDDCQVAGPEPVVAAIGNGAHGDPHRDVLIGEAGDAGEIACLHGLPVLPEPVLYTAQRAVLEVQVNAYRLLQELAPGFRFRRPGRITPGDEIEGCVRVVHRDIHVRHVVHVVRRDQRRRRCDEDG